MQAPDWHENWGYLEAPEALKVQLEHLSVHVPFTLNEDYDGFGGVLIDCDALTTLNLEQARALGALDLRGMDKVGLSLDGLTEFPLEVAEAIGTMRLDAGIGLRLRGLRALSREAADVLSRLQIYLGTLHLDGLRTLSPEAARALAADARLMGLSLDGLSEMSVKLAEALGAGMAYNLSLKGVTHLSPEAARHLASRSTLLRRMLYLDGLLELDLPLAEALAAWGLVHGQYLSLRGLEQIEPKVAGWLVRGSTHNDELRLWSLDLGFEVAQALSRFEGILNLYPTWRTRAPLESIIYLRTGRCRLRC